MEERRTQTVAFKVTAKEKEQIEKASKELSIGVSSYIRMMLLGNSRKEK